ncbi:26S proteasome regulatory subunit rpn6 [Tulasnella sp. 424]|nr:26S proteasome regulatory subunit rpn6 [Tulasnella sp. 424]
MQAESQESTSSSSATDATPLLLCMKIHVLMLGILYHTRMFNSKFASTRLTALHDLLDSDALENFPAGHASKDPEAEEESVREGRLGRVCFTLEGDHRDQETAIVKLGQIYAHQENTEKLAEVVRSFRAISLVNSESQDREPQWATPTAYFAHSLTGRLCKTDNIAWARQEKRIFLKQSLDTRLVALHLETQSYRATLGLIDGLLKELKRLSDKLILTEVHLLESRVYRGLATSPSPRYSYFFEVFENLSTNDDPKALTALKYMLLCKIMLNLPEDVTSLLQIKLAARYVQLREVDSMRAVARAHQNRNLAEFEHALKDYREELSTDPTIRTHLAALYDTLLEQNFFRIVEPYSVVDIDHVAEVVGQGRAQVEAKLSHMILDKILSGGLDQGRGCLIIFDPQEEDALYGDVIKTIEQVGKVVDSLYAKTVRIA